MDDKDVIEKTVTAIIEEVLGEPPGTVGKEEPLAARDWDSTASLEALAQLESRFGISLDLRRFHTARTIGQMADLVAVEAGAR
ncbi:MULTISPECIES: acyl carrier protein [Thermomonosporaceae]|uniref:acyl carrier protein n=1 Tax=Thermomonosporaceae TaxID=2012 RepID=UPI00255A90EF|nr:MULTISPECIES: acyl carrier protein [Thermomonosporaceae]MDL4774175.1 acyl carrier protein [Actinomadura xylanilytica]